MTTILIYNEISQINDDDGLPLNLCGKCSKRIKDFDSFRNKCRSSDDFLRILNFKEDVDNENLNDDDWQV